MITLNNINFSYNGVPVISNLSLDVAHGSWTGLVGPNGVGKTTLLKLISGALRAATGEIKIGDKELISYARGEIAKLIAVVPQESLPIFPFTAMEIVLMGRHPYLKRFGFETQKDIEVCRKIMEMTDVLQFADRPTDQLSGGERQRVLIARALVQEPKILLLDEPTTFLDLKHQSIISEILATLVKENGITIISALHDVNIAVSYCDNIALLYQGRVHRYGPPEQVITHANLKEVFDTEVYVGINESTGRPYYVPMKQREHGNKKPS